MRAFGEGENLLGVVQKDEKHNRWNMDALKLVDYLNGKIKSEELEDHIKQEVIEFERKTLNKESSIPLYADNLDFNFDIKKSHVVKICKDFSKRNDDEWFRRYIFDIIDSAKETFFPESEEVEELVFVFGNPSINTSVYQKKLDEILQSSTGVG